MFAHPAETDHSEVHACSSLLTKRSVRPPNRRNPPRKAFALLPARQRDGSSFEREVA